MARQLARFLRRREVACAPAVRRACNAVRSAAKTCRRSSWRQAAAARRQMRQKNSWPRRSRPARPALGYGGAGGKGPSVHRTERASGLLRASDRVMIGSSLDEYRRFGRSLIRMPLEGHGGPHLRRLQLKELSRIPHARIRGEGFEALQRQHQASPEGPRQGSQRIIHAQTCSSLHAGLVGNLIDPALDRTQACGRENNTHWKHTQVRGNLRSKQLGKGVRSSRPHLFRRRIPCGNGNPGSPNTERAERPPRTAKLSYREDWLIQPPRPDLNRLLTMASPS